MALALWPLALALFTVGLWWFFDASGFQSALRGGSWLLFLGTSLFPLCVLSVNDKRALSSILLLEALVCAAVLTLDCLAFYILFEACTVPLLVLITRGAVWHRAGNQSGTFQAPIRHKVSAAYRMIVYTMVGSLILLPVLLV